MGGKIGKERIRAEKRGTERGIRRHKERERVIDSARKREKQKFYFVFCNF